MKPLIVANWKMNPISRKQTEHLLGIVKKGTRGIKSSDIVLCAPFVYLEFISKKLGRDIKLGAQNVFWERNGAFTGEISSAMLKDIGCEYVILGHSERKKHIKEDCGVINKKIKMALKSRLKVVLCVGEETRDTFSKKGKWLGDVDIVLKDQLLQCLDGLDESQFSGISIAYEPVWAISTTSNAARPATPDDALSASLLIRKVISQKYSPKTARSLRVLYGGSVDSKNVTDFIKEDGIDGVLVGGASINGSEFVRLVKVIDEYYSN